MVLPGELRTLDDVDATTENPYSPGVQGKLDIAALLEDHLLEGLDTEADTAVLDHLFDNIRGQSDQALSPQQRPCRDPSKDQLLAALHAVELNRPAVYAAVQNALLAAAGVLHVAALALNAAAVWALWSRDLHAAAIAGLVLLTAHLPATSALLAFAAPSPTPSASTSATSSSTAASSSLETSSLRGSIGRFFAVWFAVPLYDIAVLSALLPLQRRTLADRRRLARRLRWLPAAELWLWQYRACRQLVLVLLHSAPMAILGLVVCISAHSRRALQAPSALEAEAGTAAAMGADGGPAAVARTVAVAAASGGGAAGSGSAFGSGPEALWVLVMAATAVSGLHALLGLGEAAMNARWAGQMSLLSYCGLALRLRGAKKLPYDWQAQLSEPRLVIRPDSRDFTDLGRPQQCQLLRLALMRPHFAIANEVTHPRPPPKTSPAAAAAAAAAAATTAAPGEGVCSACGSCTTAVAGAWARLMASCSARLGWCSKCASGGGGGGKRRRRRSSSSSDDDGPMGRPRAPPSACLLLQSKAAVKAVVGLLPGPLAAARRSLKGNPPACDLSVNLVSFRDVASCKHCRTLLELVVRQGLRSLMVADAKLQLDFFGVLTAYLPSSNCVLTRLVLKDVMSSGISTLCMLCDGMAANCSVTHLDLSNNQLWGLRGARELRGMLRGNGGLRVLMLPFCNIASPGAAEIFRGAAESGTLEQIDLSQNHIGDDVPEWGPDLAARNAVLREVDISFNWVQDSLAGWTAALLETFPSLARLHLNHNSDAANSRVASRAATPKGMTPRTLTPRTLTPSNLRMASYSTPSATAAATATAASLVAAASAAAAAAAGQRGPGTHPGSIPGHANTTTTATVTTATSTGSGSGAAAGAAPCAAAATARGSGLNTSSVPIGVAAAAAAAAAKQHAGGLGGVGGGTAALRRMASSALSPCGSERHEGQLVMSGGAAYRQGSCSLNSAGDWQAHAHAHGELPGRSRGQHLIAHFELHMLSRPPTPAAIAAAATATAAAAAAAAAAAPAAVSSAGADRVTCSTAAPAGCTAAGAAGSSLTLTALMSSMARRSSRSPSPLHSPCLSRDSRPSHPPQPQLPHPAQSYNTAATAAAAAVAVSVPVAPSVRSPGSLWAAVAAMERLDLRGVALPAWWARSPAHRPGSVLVDESLVYEEKQQQGQAVGAGGAAAAQAAGGGGGGGGCGGGMELPLHVVRSLELGLAQGMLVIDLTSHEFKSLSRCAQLAAIYLALHHATHITISNTSTSRGVAAAQPLLQQQQLSMQHSMHASSAMGGLSILRSSTSSFVRANSGMAALSGIGGGGGGGNVVPGVRLMSDTGFTSGGGVSPPRLQAIRGAGAGSGGYHTVGGGAHAAAGRSGSFMYGSGGGRPPHHHHRAYAAATALLACGGDGRLPAGQRRGPSPHADGGVSVGVGVGGLRRLAVQHGSGNGSFSVLSSLSGGGGVIAGGGGSGAQGLPFDSAAVPSGVLLPTAGSVNTMAALRPPLGGTAASGGGFQMHGSGRASSVSFPTEAAATSGHVAVTVGAPVAASSAACRLPYSTGEAVAEGSVAAASEDIAVLDGCGADAAGGKHTSSGAYSAPIITASFAGLGQQQQQQQQYAMPGLLHNELYVVGRQTLSPSAPRQASVARLLEEEDNDTPTGGGTTDAEVPASDDDFEDGLSPFMALQSLSTVPSTAAAAAAALQGHGTTSRHAAVAATAAASGPQPLPPAAASLSAHTDPNGGRSGAVGTGVGTPSFLLGPSMPQEMLDAGLAILRGSTGDSRERNGAIGGGGGIATSSTAATAAATSRNNSTPFALVLPPPSPAQPPPPPAAVSPVSGSAAAAAAAVASQQSSSSTRDGPRQSFSFIPFHRSVVETSPSSQPSQLSAPVATLSYADAASAIATGPCDSPRMGAAAAAAAGRTGPCCTSCSARLAAPAAVPSEEEDALLRDLLSLQIPRSMRQDGGGGGDNLMPLMASVSTGLEWQAGASHVSQDRSGGGGDEDPEVSFNVEGSPMAAIRNGARMDGGAGGMVNNTSTRCVTQPLSSNSRIPTRPPLGTTSQAMDANARIGSRDAAAEASAVPRNSCQGMLGDDGDEKNRARSASAAVAAAPPLGAAAGTARPHTVALPLAAAQVSLSSSSLAALSPSYSHRTGGLPSVPSQRQLNTSGGGAGAAGGGGGGAGAQLAAVSLGIPISRRNSGGSPTFFASRSLQSDSKAWLTSAPAHASAPTSQLPPPPPVLLPYQPHHNLQTHSPQPGAQERSTPHASTAAAAAACHPCQLHCYNVASPQPFHHHSMPQGLLDSATAAALRGGGAAPCISVAQLFDHTRSEAVDAAAAAAGGTDSADIVPTAATDVIGGRSVTATMPSVLRALAAAVAAAGSVGGGGVEASNAVSVVLVVGHEGGLRVPLRCLELPLREVMARRPGTTVAFRVSGLSHDGMRQLRALMAVAKVPMPERSYAWLLPSPSARLPSTTTTANGYVPSFGGGMHAGGGGVGGLLTPSQSIGFGQGMGLFGGVGGGHASASISRMDSGAVYGGGGHYNHMPSYYLDTRGQPVDLGFILPGDISISEPSGYFSAAAAAAAAAAAGGGAPSQQGYSGAANAVIPEESPEHPEQQQQQQMVRPPSPCSFPSQQQLQSHLSASPPVPVTTPGHPPLQRTAPNTPFDAETNPTAQTGGTGAEVRDGAMTSPSAFKTAALVSALRGDGCSYQQQQQQQNQDSPTASAAASGSSLQPRRSLGASLPNLPHGIMLVSLPLGRRAAAAAAAAAPSGAESTPMPPPAASVSSPVGDSPVGDASAAGGGDGGCDLYAGLLATEDLEPQPYTGTLDSGPRDRSDHSRAATGSATAAACPGSGSSGGGGSGGGGGGVNSGLAFGGAGAGGAGSGCGGLASGCGGLAVGFAPYGRLSTDAGSSLGAPPAAAALALSAAGTAPSSSSSMGMTHGGMVASAFSTLRMLAHAPAGPTVSEAPVSHCHPHMMMMMTNGASGVSGGGGGGGPSVGGVGGGAFGSSLEVGSSAGYGTTATGMTYGGGYGVYGGGGRGSAGGVGGGSVLIPGEVNSPVSGGCSHVVVAAAAQPCAEGTLDGAAATRHGATLLPAAAVTHWLSNRPLPPPLLPQPQQQQPRHSNLHQQQHKQQSPRQLQPQQRQSQQRLQQLLKQQASHGNAGGSAAPSVIAGSSGGAASAPSPASPQSPAELGSGTTCVASAAAASDGRVWSRLGGGSPASAGKASSPSAVPMAAGMDRH